MIFQGFEQCRHHQGYYLQNFQELKEYRFRATLAFSYSFHFVKDCHLSFSKHFLFQDILNVQLFNQQDQLV